VTISLRDYQTTALNAARAYVKSNRNGNPLIGVPTGGGKSLIASELMRSVKLNNRRALYLTTTEELVSQTLEDLTKLAPEVAMGATIACAGLGPVDLSGDIVLGTAQSVYRRLDEIGERAVIIVDEAHGIPRDENSMYGAIFKGRECIRIGLTATPYRLDSGRLDEGEGAPFTKMVYQVQTRELQRRGFLCPLKYRKSKIEIDTSSVRVNRGEFVVADLEIEALNQEVCEKIAKDFYDTFVEFHRTKALAFCVSVRHAAMLAAEIRKLGGFADVVSNETPKDRRREIIAKFRAGSIDVLCNVNIAAVGFNVPDVDFIASCAPTMSTGRWVQTVGRGLRIADGKDYCLVKDYAGNCFRHGIVEEIERGVVRQGNDRAKLCPVCEAVMPKHALKCPECGAVLPQIVRSVLPDRLIDLKRGAWLKVDSGSFGVWHKEGRPEWLKATFRCQGKVFSLWIPFGEDDAWLRAQGRKRWLSLGGNEPVPLTARDAVQRANMGGELQVPAEIMVRENRKGFKAIEDVDL
jgi:DNA repair protein RadD